MTFQLSGGSQATLNITGWNSDREVATFDVTGTRHAGITARIAGKKDARGTVTACFDLDAAPYGLTTPAIREGAIGVIREYVDATGAQFITTPIIVKKLHHESAIGNELRWTFDWELNSLAGSPSYPN